MPKFLCFRRNSPSMTEKDLLHKIHELEETCFVKASEEKIRKCKRDKCLCTLSNIVSRCTRLQLQLHEPQVLIRSSLKILLRYGNILYTSENEVFEWRKRKRYKQSRDCYNSLLKIYIPERSKELTKEVVDMIHEEKVWLMRPLCFEVVYDLVKSGVSGALVANFLCDKIELPKFQEISVAEPTVRILYELLDVYDWSETEETTHFVERLLKLYRKSLSTSSYRASAFSVLKRGLEMCIRYLIKHLPNSHLLIVVQRMCSWTTNKESNDTAILEFCNTLELAAYTHQMDLFKDTLTSDIFSLLMLMISSDNRLVSLLGNRVLQYLIDRGENRTLFDAPRILLKDAQFDIKIGLYRREDKLFLKLHREVIHDSLLKSVIIHRSSRLNLETTYSTICLIATEVPCGFTAAAIVCLTMNLQQVTLNQNDHHVESYHVHAVVISIMSLLCWIHNADDLYIYIEKVMMERAEWAPHLNPPLQTRYNFAVHHILWNKPELFFVDWETRYGLWRRFRLYENKRMSRPIHKLSQDKL